MCPGLVRMMWLPRCLATRQPKYSNARTTSDGFNRGSGGIYTRNRIRLPHGACLSVLALALARMKSFPHLGAAAWGRCTRAVEEAVDVAIQLGHGLTSAHATALRFTLRFPQLFYPAFAPIENA